MDRLTEYHGDKAVIKDKTRPGEVMEKLARFENRSARRKAIDRMLDRLDKTGEKKVYYLLKGILVEEVT